MSKLSSKSFGGTETEVEKVMMGKAIVKFKEENKKVRLWLGDFLYVSLTECDVAFK